GGAFAIVAVTCPPAVPVVAPSVTVGRAATVTTIGATSSRFVAASVTWIRPKYVPAESDATSTARVAVEGVVADVASIAAHGAPATPTLKARAPLVDVTETGTCACA